MGAGLFDEVVPQLSGPPFATGDVGPNLHLRNEFGSWVREQAIWPDQVARE